MNLSPIIIPNYVGSSWVKNLITDRNDEMINLDPEVGSKRQNNIALIESFKLADPNLSLEILSSQPSRSALVGVLTLFNCPLDRLREAISLLNRRERNLARYVLIGDENFITLITEVEREEQRQLHLRLRNNFLVITGPLINLNEDALMVSSESDNSDSEDSDNDSSDEDSNQGWAPPSIIIRFNDYHRQYNNTNQ